MICSIIKEMKKLSVALAAIIFCLVGLGFCGSGAYAATCGGVEVSVLGCDTQPTGGGANNSGGAANSDDIQNSGVWKLLELILNIMSGLVLVLAVGGIVYAAIMYASAQDNASQVQQAIENIRNVVIGLVLYILMYALLQFLIPGGIF